MTTCDEIIDVKAKLDDAEKNFNEKKTQSVKENILLAFLLITIALLIAVSIYCYLIKFRLKQKLLLPFHKWQINKCIINIDSYDELKEINIKIVRVIISMTFLKLKTLILIIF